MPSRSADEHDGIGDQRRFRAVEIAHERLQPAVIFQHELLLLDAALVGQHDRDAGIQERELAQAMLQRREVEFGLGEGLRARQERDFGAALALGVADHLRAAPSGSPSWKRM